jgi:flagellar P-ring protein precursor FlgI
MNPTTVRKLVCLVALGLCAGPSQGEVRIKDVTELKGAITNKVYGIGLVTGLDNTGSRGMLTQKMAADLLQRFNIFTKTVAELRGDVVIKPTSCAAVTVIADLGPFNQKGSRVDVTVSSMEDATSLAGGTLMPTQLLGPDNVVYVLAAGQISVNGFNVGVPSGSPTPSAAVQKNHPTVGRIPGGGDVVLSVPGKYLEGNQMCFLLSHPDFNTSRTIAQAINKKYPGTAVAIDPSQVQVFIPRSHLLRHVEFVNDIGLLEITPDSPAYVVINERTGTIVAGEKVKISTVSIMHGNISIVTADNPIVSQPAPFSKGKTVVVPRAEIGVQEQAGSMRVLEKTMTAGDLARALNALGASPRDVINFFQHIDQIGALHAKLKII